MRLDPDNLRRDLDSPAMRGLAGLGYVPGPAFQYLERAGADPVILLVLYRPPAPPTQMVEPSPWTERSVRGLRGGLVAVLVLQFLTVLALCAGLLLRGA